VLSTPPVLDYFRPPSRKLDLIPLFHAVGSASIIILGIYFERTLQPHPDPTANEQVFRRIRLIAVVLVFWLLFGVLAWFGGIRRRSWLLTCSIICDVWFCIEFL
jgi:hypothetical protein